MGDFVERLEHELAWDTEADVVVVGGGIAGLSTVVNLADLGASVILLEKGYECGGTSAKAAAGMMIPNNRHMQDAGQTDPKEDFIRFLARVGRPLLYDANHPRFGLPEWEYELIGVYWENAAPGLEKLQELGAIETMHVPEWPSYNDLPEDKGRFGRVLFTVGPDGEMGSGATCIARLRDSAERMGAQVRTRHRVEGVYVNGDGAVVGVRARTDDEEVSVRANRAVVFASGGFVHNDDLRREYLSGFYPGGCAARTGEGDLVPIAKALGVPLYHMHSVWGSPLVFEHALDKDPGLIPNFSIPGDSIIQVNRYGVRVGNEKTTYNDRTQSHFIWDPARAEYPNWLQYAIWDQRNQDLFPRTPGLETGNFIPPKEGAAPRSAQELAGLALVGAVPSAEGADPWKYIVRGETLEELALNLDERLASLADHTGGVRLDERFAERLTATIARYNEFARNGVDEDFHRGESAIESYMHGERAPDNELENFMMYPLSDAGPYYATILAPGAIDTKGGPKVSGRLQILDGLERPVRGLYGIGNCVASASGQAYWSGGGTFGPYIAFAYAAARSIVQEPIKQLPAGELAARGG